MGKVGDVSMEEYKNLEEIIELCEEELNNNDKNVTATLDLIDLKELRNLINRNKELEEENRTLKEDYQTKNQYYKEKIEEKIEELKKIKYSEEKCDKINNMYFKMIKQYDYEIAQFTIKILQELLEE